MKVQGGIAWNSVGHSLTETTQPLTTLSLRIAQREARSPVAFGGSGLRHEVSTKRGDGLEDLFHFFPRSDFNSLYHLDLFPFLHLNSLRFILGSATKLQISQSHFPLFLDQIDFLTDF